MQAERTHEIDATAPVIEQASAWWILLNEGQPSEADQRAFSEWMTRSPERVSAYLQAARVGRAFRSPRTQWPDTPVDELIRNAMASNVAQLHSSAEPARPRFAPRPAIAALAAIVAVAICIYLYPQSERFETALGEQHSVVLSDGSLVTLNTTSAIKLSFGATRRGITLLEGEALFQVAHDAERPFEVTAGDATVRAIGTQFNVDRHLQTLEVTVLEGRVEVSRGSEHASLGAGEQATLPPQGALQVSRVNTNVATAWTQRQLIFENKPLGDVATELNRYNRQIIDIQSAELRDQPVTGVFQSNDPATFLAFLRRIPGANVEASADGSRYVVRMTEQP